MIHFIALAEYGKDRFAYDYSVEPSEFSKIEKKRKDLFNVAECYPQVEYSMHVVKCEGSTFKDIQEKDAYFEGVELCSSIGDFMKKVNRELPLNSIDIIEYIKNKFNLGEFQLQKTLYYVYAELLLKFKERIFNANIVAFDKGPVDWGVYVMSKYHKDILDNTGFFNEKISNFKNKEEVIKTIDEVSKKYSSYFNEVWKNFQSSNPEYNLTHKEGTPWNKSYVQGENVPIKDEDIIKYHYKEII